MSRFKGDRGYQAFRILQVAFVIVPIVSGLDKFFNLLTNWMHYLSPYVSHLIQNHDKVFMMGAGLVEIIAGIGIIYKPKVFAYIVALWLLGIIVNLILLGGYDDIALRDFGLFLGAIAFARLSATYDTP